MTVRNVLAMTKRLKGRPLIRDLMIWNYHGHA